MKPWSNGWPVWQQHCYAPLDFPWVVSRFIERLKPCLYLFVETELWPNLLWQLRRRGVPTVLVNGRLSTRSFARQQWAPVRSFYRTMLQTLSLCLMQSDRDVDRIVALGAEAFSSQADREYQVRSADTGRHGGRGDEGSSWASGYGTAVCGRQYPSR